VSAKEVCLVTYFASLLPHPLWPHAEWLGDLYTDRWIYFILFEGKLKGFFFGKHINEKLHPVIEIVVLDMKPGIYTTKGLNVTGGRKMQGNS
jgi:hypothetical protein